MSLSLCGLGSSETMYNKLLCGKPCIFKTSFTSKGEKASVYSTRTPPTYSPTGSETRGSDVHSESLVLWFQLSPGERSTEKFKGAEKLMQLENQAKPEQV